MASKKRLKVNPINTEFKTIGYARGTKKLRTIRKTKINWYHKPKRSAVRDSCSLADQGQTPYEETAVAGLALHLDEQLDLEPEGLGVGVDAGTDNRDLHVPRPMGQAKQVTKTITEDNDHDLSDWQRRQKEQAEQWENVRISLSDVILMQQNLPPLTVCSVCNEKPNDVVRCTQCGPGVFYCKECCEKSHKRIFLHVPEIWQKNAEAFIPIEYPAQVWSLTHTDECPSAFIRNICVIDILGTQHPVQIKGCQCEQFTVTLLRYQLWPSTPQNPTFAIHLDLMHWMRILILECHVSLKKLFDALKLKGSTSLFGIGLRMDFENLYKAFSNSMMEFLEVTHSTSHLKHQCPGLLQPSSCPACPLNEEKVLCMDANFGLVRKKSAGSDVIPQRMKNLFFHDQATVNEFVAHYNDASSKQHNCNNFQAGKQLRSETAEKKLDVTGVFGAVCRHDMPQYFCDLLHGERLAYAVYVLRQMKCSKTSYVLYDIACMLHSHLKKKGDKDLLDLFKYAVPIFHSFGHKVSCQLEYSPRRAQGLGLVDGESMERLWSYLRPFSKMTKEMRPANRHDILTHALLHYGSKQVTKLEHPTVMKQKILRAAAVQNDCEKKLQKLLSEVNLPNRAVLSQISNFHSATVVETPLQADNWREEYALLLHKYFSEKKKTFSDPSDIAHSHEKISRLEIDLLKIEKKRKIKSRWDERSQSMESWIHIAATKKRKLILVEIRKHVAERVFLLQAKSKEARGQKVAVRLSRLINKASRDIKTSLEAYRETPVMADGLPKKLEYKTVIDLNDSMWACIESGNGQSSIPRPVLLQADELLSTIKRCEEETILVHNDIKHIFSQRLTQYSEILRQYEAVANTPREKAIKCHLSSHGWVFECVLRRFADAFGEILAFPTVPDTFRKLFNHHVAPLETSADSSDSDSESETEYFTYWEQSA